MRDGILGEGGVRLIVRGVGEGWALRVAREDRREVEGRGWRGYVWRKGEGGGRRVEKEGNWVGEMVRCQTGEMERGRGRGGRERGREREGEGGRGKGKGGNMERERGGQEGGRERGGG